MELSNNEESIDYKIILVHEPDISSKIVKDYQVNLILAGHSHNGQIRLPIIGAIYTPEHAKNYYDNDTLTSNDLSGFSKAIFEGRKFLWSNQRLRPY